MVDSLAKTNEILDNPKKLKVEHNSCNECRRFMIDCPGYNDVKLRRCYVPKKLKDKPIMYLPVIEKDKHWLTCLHSGNNGTRDLKDPFSKVIFENVELKSGTKVPVSHMFSKHNPPVKAWLKTKR